MDMWQVQEKVKSQTVLWGCQHKADFQLWVLFLPGVVSTELKTGSSPTFQVGGASRAKVCANICSFLFWFDKDWGEGCLDVIWQSLRWLFWCSGEHPAYHKEFTSGCVLAAECGEPVEDHSGITPRI